MRTAIVAILSLSSFVLQAQASTPAQTADSGNESAQIKRVSTGVIAPKLIYKVDVVAQSPDAARMINSDTRVVVGMIVDRSGKPSDLKIIQSAGASVDASVLAAVSQYRFTPGMVSNEPTPSPLNLEVLISNVYR